MMLFIMLMLFFVPQVMELKLHHHDHCNTTTNTTTRLTVQCKALSHACDHLSACLEASALARKDNLLLTRVAEVKGQLQEVTKEITESSMKLQVCSYLLLL